MAKRSKRSFTVIPLDVDGDQNFADLMYRDQQTAVDAAHSMMEREPEIAYCRVNVDVFNGTYWAADPSLTFVIGRNDK